MKKEYLDRVEKCLKDNDIDPTNLTSKEKLRALKNIIFERKVDLDLLEMDANNIDAITLNYVSKIETINLEIHNAIVCKNIVKLVRKEERKNKIKKMFIKKSR